jgi:cysteinyl-tRNA synthetase
MVPEASAARGDLPAAFAAAMDDDLAVPQALAVLHETVRAGNTALDEGDREAVAGAVTAVDGMLRVLGLDAADRARGDDAGTIALDALVRTMIDQRAEARASKDWATADRIRDAIAAAGIVLEDGPEGTHWSVNRG